MSINKQLKIGDLTAKLPIIQGGMGVGVSRSSLAGAVAKEGGVGIISTAQIGYDEEGFEKDQAACNNRAIHKHIKRAKELAQGNGLVGVNIMVALKHYAEHVKEAVAAGADVIISGAGLPMNLPELVSETCRTKIAPIVSSKRAAQLILKMWAHKYDRTADFLVVEGPKAGGHLGFSREQLDEIDTMDYDEEIRQIIACKEEYEKRYGKKIPVIVEDVQIIQSPVGMPGRALRNALIDRVEKEKEPIKKCYNCLAKCNPGKVPYCITKALIDAVKGDVENGLVFCGSNVGRINQMMSVHELMQELVS